MKTKNGGVGEEDWHRRDFFYKADFKCTETYCLLQKGDE